MDESAIDAYLSKVGRSLRFMPASRRSEELAELRLHLESLTARAGFTGEASPEGDAIRQFGIPSAVGQRILAVWWRGRLRDGMRNTLVPMVLLYAAFNAPSFVNHWISPGILSGVLIYFEVWPFALLFVAGFLLRRRALTVVPTMFLLSEVVWVINAVRLGRAQYLTYWSLIDFAFETTLYLWCAVAGAIIRRWMSRNSPSRKQLSPH